MQKSSPIIEPLPLAPSTGDNGEVSASTTIEIVETSQGFDDLHEQWNALFEENGFSVFQSFEWQRTWWKHFGEHHPGMRLAILLVRVDGVVAAIAPFFFESLRVFGVVSIRRMSLVGRGQSDYLDLLVSKGHESLCLDAIAGYLSSHRKDFDLLVIEDYSERSPLNMVWHEALARHDFDVERVITEYCPRMVFKPTWAETLASLPCNRSRKMDKFRRQLASRFNAELELTGASTSVEKDLDDFTSLHQQRWGKVGHAGLFADPGFEAFFRDVVAQLKRKNRLLLAFYKFDGERRLAIIGFMHRNEFQYYLSGLGDPGKTTHHSPGMVLHTLCMEFLFARGIRVYDFLRGTESYKEDLGGVLIPSWTITATSRGGERARRNYQWLLIQKSLLRRAQLEWSLFQHTRSAHGLFSAPMNKHISRRWKALVRDGVLKAKHPETSVAAAERTE